MKRILDCAKAILDRAAPHTLSDAAITDLLHDILFPRKDAWRCVREGLITEEETANLLLAHLHTLFEHTCGRRLDHTPEDAIAMQQALFES